MARHYRLLIVFIFTGLALAACLAFIHSHYGETFGVSRDVFTIFCGSLATLFSVLIGLVIAAIALIVQNALTSWRMNRAILLREEKWLQSWIRSNGPQFPDIQQKFKDLERACSAPSIFSRKPAPSENWTEAVSGALDAIETRVSDFESKALGEQTREEGALRNDDLTAIGGSNLAQSERTLRNLFQHVRAIAEAWAGIEGASLSLEMASLLGRLIVTVGINLVFAVVFMLWSGLDSAGEELVSNMTRLMWAVMLMWAFLGNLLLISHTVSLHLKMVRRVDIPW